MNTQFWDIVKTVDDPTQVGREGDLVRTGMNNARTASRLMPAIRALGTIGVSEAAFQIGWKIGRGIDTRWLHLGGDVGTWTGASLIGPGAMQWRFRDFWSPLSANRPFNSWALEQSSEYYSDYGRNVAIDPSSCVYYDAFCYGWGGAGGGTAQKKQVNKELFDYLTRADVPGTLVI